MNRLDCNATNYKGFLVDDWKPLSLNASCRLSFGSYQRLARTLRASDFVSWYVCRLLWSVSPLCLCASKRVLSMPSFRTQKANIYQLTNQCYFCRRLDTGSQPLRLRILVWGWPLPAVSVDMIKHLRVAGLRALMKSLKLEGLHFYGTTSIHRSAGTGGNSGRVTATDVQPASSPSSIPALSLTSILYFENHSPFTVATSASSHFTLWWRQAEEGLEGDDGWVQLGDGECGPFVLDNGSNQVQVKGELRMPLLKQSRGNYKARIHTNRCIHTDIPT